MLYPSIDKLTEKMDSKYVLVSVAAKRARQLRENSNVQIEKPKSKKYVGQALEEIITDQLVYIESDSRQ
ncbi:DNA-directed RNA polymerase subunit omega [Brevibacillus humidisoli]|uniref:DNA-directed RNA polymerase subunit omega n=1 Tax=Brevibacillus humidisoli TaxID=2895522 RepID=UPI001E42E766|nr:DNA-directed RNA polymerase subunit omega [Brevibacillus humidisoli]UFJ43228.1 DNA-directed RNA polymerase subunit omega [Brevibacillus humidisoli]